MKIITFTLVLVMAAIAIGSLAIVQPASQPNNPSAWVGRQAPYFSLPEVNDSSFILQQYTNKSNVLLFFNEGLTCSPCLQQMVDLSNDYKGFQTINVTLVAITGDSKANLAQWAQNNNVSHIIVLSDQNLSVDKLYKTLGSNVSMMPGTKGGHTFVLANHSGIIRWRADYGPGLMYVPDAEIYSNVARALSN